MRVSYAEMLRCKKLSEFGEVKKMKKKEVRFCPACRQEKPAEEFKGIFCNSCVCDKDDPGEGFVLKLPCGGIIDTRK